MTRTPLSRSKGQDHQAALLSAALTRKAAAAVSVGTYSAWESTATLRLLGGARGAWTPTGEDGAGGILWRHAEWCLAMSVIYISMLYIVLLFIRASVYVLLVFIAMCAVFWLFWLSYQYLPSDWLERLLFCVSLVS